MGQVQDRTEAGNQYDGARAWLAFLIDNPDKTVSVAEYKAQLRDAKKAVRVAEDKKRLESYVAKVVAEAPPLTPEQRDRLAMLLRGDGYVPSATIRQERPEIIAIRNAETALAGARSAFTKALGLCRYCDLNEKVHYYQKDYGIGFHDFVALTPEDVVKMAKSHGKAITAAERALEKARG